MEHIKFVILKLLNIYGQAQFDAPVAAVPLTAALDSPYSVYTGNYKFITLNISY
jgi:hypothetical protein